MRRNAVMACGTPLFVMSGSARAGLNRRHWRHDVRVRISCIEGRSAATAAFRAAIPSL